LVELSLYKKVRRLLSEWWQFNTNEDNGQVFPFPESISYGSFEEESEEADAKLEKGRELE